MMAVIDTCCLISSLAQVEKLHKLQTYAQPTTLLIPVTVVWELDWQKERFRRGGRTRDFAHEERIKVEETGRAAIRASHFLERHHGEPWLRQQTIEETWEIRKRFPEMKLDTGDSVILATAMYHQQLALNDVVLLSEDRNLRVLAHGQHIAAFTVDEFVNLLQRHTHTPSRRHDDAGTSSAPESESPGVDHLIRQIERLVLDDQKKQKIVQAALAVRSQTGQGTKETGESGASNQKRARRSTSMPHSKSRETRHRSGTSESSDTDSESASEDDSERGHRHSHKHRVASSPDTGLSSESESENDHTKGHGGRRKDTANRKASKSSYTHSSSESEKTRKESPRDAQKDSSNRRARHQTKSSDTGSSSESTSDREKGHGRVRKDTGRTKTRSRLTPSDGYSDSDSALDSRSGGNGRGSSHQGGQGGRREASKASGRAKVGSSDSESRSDSRDRGTRRGGSPRRGHRDGTKGPSKASERAKPPSGAEPSRSGSESEGGTAGRGHGVPRNARTRELNPAGPKHRSKGEGGGVDPTQRREPGSPKTDWTSQSVAAGREAGVSYRPHRKEKSTERSRASRSRTHQRGRSSGGSSSNKSKRNAQGKPGRQAALQRETQRRSKLTSDSEKGNGADGRRHERSKPSEPKSESRSRSRIHERSRSSGRGHRSRCAEQNDRSSKAAAAGRARPRSESESESSDRAARHGRPEPVVGTESRGGHGRGQSNGTPRSRAAKVSPEKKSGGSCAQSRESNSRKPPSTGSAMTQAKPRLEPGSDWSGLRRLFPDSTADRLEAYVHANVSKTHRPVDRMGSSSKSHYHPRQQSGSSSTSKLAEPLGTSRAAVPPSTIVRLQHASHGTSGPASIENKPEASSKEAEMQDFLRKFFPFFEPGAIAELSRPPVPELTKALKPANREPPVDLKEPSKPDSRRGGPRSVHGPRDSESESERRQGRGRRTESPQDKENIEDSRAGPSGPIANVSCAPPIKIKGQRHADAAVAIGPQLNRDHVSEETNQVKGNTSSRPITKHPESRSTDAAEPKKYLEDGTARFLEDAVPRPWYGDRGVRPR